MTWWIEGENRDREDDQSYIRKRNEYEAILEMLEDEREFNREKIREHGFRVGVLY
jgi:hypothetical protein